MSVVDGMKNMTVGDLAPDESVLQHIQTCKRVQRGGQDNILRMITDMRDRQDAHMKSIKRGSATMHSKKEPVPLLEATRLLARNLTINITTATNHINDRLRLVKALDVSCKEIRR